eukprot:scaffold131959_cov63-Phaeocystis_antarctica.AAC.2
MVRAPEPLRQRLAARRSRSSALVCPRAHATVPSRSQSTPPMRVSCREMPPRSARRLTRANIVSAPTELRRDVGGAAAAARHELGGVVAHACGHRGEGRREHVVHERLELSVALDRSSHPLQVDGGALGTALAARRWPLARRGAEVGGLETHPQVERAVDGALRRSCGLLEPCARARPQLRADVEDVHLVPRLDGAQHRPEPGVGDHRHRADGGHALAARLGAHVRLLEQVAVERLQLREAVDHRRVEEEDVVAPAADREQVLHVADELAGELLRRLELVREPGGEVGADGVALAGEERHVLRALVDKRARRRREPADARAHLRLEDLVDRLAPFLANVGDGVVRARRIVLHVAAAAASVAATREPRRLARGSGAVVRRARWRELGDLALLPDTPPRALLLEEVSRRRGLLRSSLLRLGQRLPAVVKRAELGRLAPRLGDRGERRLELLLLPDRRLVGDLVDRHRHGLELARLLVPSEEQLGEDLALLRVRGIGHVAVRGLGVLEQPLTDLHGVQLVADGRQLLDVGLARDVEHVLPLVDALAVRSRARLEHLLRARRDLDAVEAAEDDEEHRHHVGGDAEGDHLERRQVDLGGVVAALEELFLRRLGDSAQPRRLCLDHCYPLGRRLLRRGQALVCCRLRRCELLTRGLLELRVLLPQPLVLLLERVDVEEAPVGAGIVRRHLRYQLFDAPTKPKQLLVLDLSPGAPLRQLRLELVGATERRLARRLRAIGARLLLAHTRPRPALVAHPGRLRLCLRGLVQRSLQHLAWVRVRVRVSGQWAGSVVRVRVRVKVRVRERQPAPCVSCCARARAQGS